MLTTPLIVLLLIALLLTHFLPIPAEIPVRERVVRREREK